MTQTEEQAQMRADRRAGFDMAVGLLRAVQASRISRRMPGSIKHSFDGIKFANESVRGGFMAGASLAMAYDEAGGTIPTPQDAAGMTIGDFVCSVAAQNRIRFTYEAPDCEVSFGEPVASLSPHGERIVGDEVTMIRKGPDGFEYDVVKAGQQAHQFADRDEFADVLAVKLIRRTAMVGLNNSKLCNEAIRACEHLSSILCRHDDSEVVAAVLEWYAAQPDLVQRIVMATLTAGGG